MILIFLSPYPEMASSDVLPPPSPISTAPYLPYRHHHSKTHWLKRNLLATILPEEPLITERIALRSWLNKDSALLRRPGQTELLHEATIGSRIGLVTSTAGAVVGAVGSVVAPDVDAGGCAVTLVLLGEGVAPRAGGLAGGVVGRALR